MAVWSRSARTLAVMASGAPNSARTWSTRCGPRSKSIPFAGFSASFHVFSRGMGRKRSKCDSNVTRRPMASFLQQLADGLKVPSQRRLWKGIASRPLLLASWPSSRASALVAAKGLSMTTCLPASSACFARAKWVSFGVEHDHYSMDLSARGAFERALDLDCRDRPSPPRRPCAA